MREVRHLILDESDTLLDDSFNELLIRYLKKFKVIIFHISFSFILAIRKLQLYITSKLFVIIFISIK